MTQGLPGFYGPPPSAAELVPADDADVWTGVWVVGGGLVATLGLLALTAWANASEHKAIREEIDEVDKDLVDYKNSHAYVHAVIAQEQAMMHAGLQQQIDGLRTLVPATMAPVMTAMPSVSPTVYGEPLLSPVPVSVATLPASSLAFAPTSRPTFSMVPSTVASTAPSTAPAMSVRGATLPSHIEAAMASVVPASRQATLRQSAVPTLRQSKAPTRRAAPSNVPTATYPTMQLGSIPSVPSYATLRNSHVPT